MEQGSLCNYFDNGPPQTCSTQTTLAFLGAMLPDGGGCTRLLFGGHAPDMVAYDSAGALWVDVLAGSGDHDIWRLASDGGFPTAPLAAFSATLGNGDVPLAITGGPPGQLIVAGSSGDFFLLLTDGGTTVISGLALQPCSPPTSLAFDPTSSKVYLVSPTCPNVESAPFPDGPWANVYADSGLSNPFGVTVSNGQAYVSDTQYSQIFQVAPSHAAAVAGSAAIGGFVDGATCSNGNLSCASLCATLCAPQALATGRGGSLVFLDETVVGIRAVNLDAGVVQTLLGVPAADCACTSSFDTGKNTGCTSNQPFSLNFSTVQTGPSGSALAADGVDGDIFLAWTGGAAVLVLESNP